jgi:hypothetical protein
VGGKFYVAVMERLDCTIMQAKDKCKHPHAVALHAAVCHERERFKPLHQIRKVAPPHLADFIAEFSVDLGVGEHQLDMHSENWMVRADGSLVLADPVTRVPTEMRSSNTRKRLRAREFATLQHAA